MKKVFLLLAIFSVNYMAHAVKVKGIVVTSELETKKIIFKIPTRLFSKEIKMEKLQNKIPIYHPRKKIGKTYIHPNQIKEAKFSYKGEEFRFLSRWNTITNKPERQSRLFLQLLSDGKLNLYRYYPTGQKSRFETLFSKEEYFYQKQGKELQSVYQFFKPGIVNYFDECPEIINKVRNKEFEIKDIVKIVDEYNETCK